MNIKPVKKMLERMRTLPQDDTLISDKPKKSGITYCIFIPSLKCLKLKFNIPK